MNLTPSMFVNEDYEMDPQFDDLLFDGTQLKDGMVVLIESSDLRKDPYDVKDEKEMRRVRETNRWATISHVVIDAGVQFIATYADGIKKKRSYHTSHAWLVKIDSMPDQPKSMDNYETSPTYRKVLELVKDAMLIQDVATYHGEGLTGAEGVAQKTSREIMNLF